MVSQFVRYRQGLRCTWHNIGYSSLLLIADTIDISLLSLRSSVGICLSLLSFKLVKYKSGDRNLKLENKRRQEPEHKRVIIFCVGQMSTLFTCCAHQKDSGVLGQRPWSVGSWGETLLKLKHLAFGHSMVAANLPVFFIFRRQKLSCSYDV